MLRAKAARAPGRPEYPQPIITSSLGGALQPASPKSPGIWNLGRDEPFVRVICDWTMKRSEETLKLELRRRWRRPLSPKDLARIPPRPSLVVRILSLDK